MLAERPRGVEQPRKKLECIGKRAECIENSPHAKNATPGFRSILACDGPQRGCVILNFPGFEQFSQTIVPRIRYTWYALVFEDARRFSTSCPTSSSQRCHLSVLFEVLLALKGNVARNESWFAKIVSFSAFRRSNRGGRTCSTSPMT